MKNIILIFIHLFFYNPVVQETGTENFDFVKKFKLTKSSKKLKIKSIDPFDQFSGNLKGCYSSFYDNLEKRQTYYLKNTKNDIVVVEYIFKDTLSSNSSFKMVSSFADFIRNLSRVEYAKRCFPIWEEQIYYALKKGRHVYLFTFIGNITFDKWEDTVNYFFNSNKEIIINDLYNEFKNIDKM